MTECARHPGTEAYISCQRCSRPICPDCQIPAAVGFQCPDCVKAANKGRREATTAFGGRVTDGRPLVTFVLVAVAAVLLLLGMLPTVSQVLNLLYFSPLAGSGQPWRFLTYSIAGGGSFVPILSLFALYLIGRELEPQLGRARFAAAWAVCALGGSAVLSLVGPANALLFGVAAPALGLAATWLVTNRARLSQMPWLVWIVLVVTLFSAPWPALIGCVAAGAAVGGVLLAGSRERRTVVHWGGLGGLALLLLALSAVGALV